MKFGKIFKFAKKGSKMAAKKKGKGGAQTASVWPGGLRVGVFGHANTGKTVYFTVLNEECKISKDLQISVTDNATAGELLSHYRSIWGLGTTSDVGTIVDARGDKAFPDPTKAEKILQFTAILDRSKKIPVVGLDYNGAALSISGEAASSEKIDDFMQGCDGLLFFYDPKIMGAELESQARVASFVNMLETLAPLSSRLPIPVGLVITKADILPGFNGDDHVTLVPPENEYLVSEDFELFLERILSDPKVSANPTWAGSVRTVLLRLQEFLKVVVGRTLDFQIFFVSSTGVTPEKIGTDVGRSIYKPPSKMQPIGVRKPFYWLLNAITLNRSISRFRKLAKFVTIVSLIWIIGYSLPFVWHLNWVFKQPQKVEANILEQYDGNAYNISQKERAKIISEYSKYERAAMVKWFFPAFQAPARRIKETYSRQNIQEAVKNLNTHIARFAAIVADKNLWPTLNPSDSTIILNEQHKDLITALQDYHKGDENSILYTRSGRALTYWDLFVQSISHPGDTLIWQTIQQQIQTDRNLSGNEMSPEEMQLTDLLSSRKVEKVKKVVAQKASVDFDGVIERINGNNDPKFRLEDAVTELTKVRSQLDPAADKSKIDNIDRYIRRADSWKTGKEFAYKVENIPGDGHLHVEVVEKGKSPTWSEKTQILADGDEYRLNWKIGDDIYIAYDSLGQAENWGKVSSDRKILNSRYSIFDMAGEVTFETSKVTVTFKMVTDLNDMLPKLR